VLHPGLAPFAPWLAGFRDAGQDTLNALARERSLALPDGRPLVFVEARGRQRALDYERAIAQRGEIATRTGSDHDVLNAFAWLAFPRVKAALNALHVAGAAVAPPATRSRVRDAATLLDESGLVLACADAGMVALLREHAWRTLFWTRRDEVARRMRPMVVGHGLAAKLLQPFRAITAKVLVVPVEPSTLPQDSTALAALDRAAAAAVAAAGFSPQCLTPLPVAALPGWSDERLGERLFDDTSVFRPRVIGS
jgi:hypothetical protein